MAEELNRYTHPMHLILFDVDGTLIKGHGMGRIALERAFAEIHGVPAEDNPVVRTVLFAGNSDPYILADMARVLEVAADAFHARAAELEEAYVRHLRQTVAQAENLAPCPGVAELLPRLDAHPVLALGLLTGNIEAGARVKLERFGMNRYFPFGGFGGDGRDRAEMARAARERAERATGCAFAPEDVLVVGDTVYDITAGRDNGFLTAGVGTGPVSLEAMQAAGATKVFEDLTPRHGFEAWLGNRWDLAPEADPC
jgi:phosphoglycolate phosphatase